MAKCGIVGCAEKAIGGFREIVDARTLDDPTAAIPGLTTCWCKAHESTLRPTVLGKRGVWLTEKQLRNS
jgi:hypothetical protein